MSTTDVIRPGDRHGYHLKWCDQLDELNTRCYMAVSEVLDVCVLERQMNVACGKQHLIVLTRKEGRVVREKAEELVYPSEMLADRETMRSCMIRIDPRLHPWHNEETPT